MKLILCILILCVSVYEIVCPPVAPNPQPIEGDSPDQEDVGFGLEYDRYLREVVMALEEDETFRKKLEEMNISDIKNGKIAMHLDLVSHQIRERLDEVKRQEIQRLRMLARQKMEKMNGIQKMDQLYPHHVDVKNPHSFEMKDLENLIKKATSDLDEIDKKRKKEFQEYEMDKEHNKREELKKLNEEERKVKEEEYEDMKKRHEEHPSVHHPGSKAQLEDVWEKTDNMDPEDFDPKTFFKMHDITGDGFLDQDEVEALFQKELDQVYDPNMPEDDMRERYEDMSRMREHVFKEIDQDNDRLISLDEFLKYTASQEFEKDEGWKTVDEQKNYTEEEFQQYEALLRQHEEEMRAKGLDPNMVQPGMVPLGHDPNVQQMEMPHEQQGMNQQQQQQQALHFQQQQQQQMGQGQIPHQGQVPMQGQVPHQGQMPGQGQGQMPGHGQMPAQMPGGQGQMNMDQGHMPGGQNMGHMPQMGQEENKVLETAQQEVPAQNSQDQTQNAADTAAQQEVDQGHPADQGHVLAEGQGQGQVEPKNSEHVETQNQGTDPVNQEQEQQQQQQEETGIPQQPIHGQPPQQPIHGQPPQQQVNVNVPQQQQQQQQGQGQQQQGQNRPMV